MGTADIFGNHRYGGFRQRPGRGMGPHYYLFVCPEGAATAVALKKFLELDDISPEEEVLLLNTGSGLKYLESY